MSSLKIFNLHTMYRNGACCCPHIRTDKTNAGRHFQKTKGYFIYRSLLATHRRQALALCFAVTTNNGKNIVCFVAHLNIIYYIYNISYLCQIGICYIFPLWFLFFFVKSIDNGFFFLYNLLVNKI